MENIGKGGGTAVVLSVFFPDIFAERIANNHFNLTFLFFNYGPSARFLINYYVRALRSFSFKEINSYMKKPSVMVWLDQSATLYTVDRLLHSLKETWLLYFIHIFTS